MATILRLRAYDNWSIAIHWWHSALNIEHSIDQGLQGLHVVWSVVSVAVVN